MSALPQEPIHMTDEQYLAFESSSEYRHELIEGYSYAMAGSSNNHSIICTNLIIGLGAQLRKRPCIVHGKGMQVRPKEKGLFFYPDVSVVRGEEKLTDTSVPSLTNPNVIIEVLSPCTEKVDRGVKASAYRGMESVKEYLFVSQNSAHIEHYKRMPNGHWDFVEYKGREAVIDLPSIECTLALEDVYEKVEFEED